MRRHLFFAWTDEWHRGGYDIEDWDFGLTKRDRGPKSALTVVHKAFAEVPFPPDLPCPRISVVVCSYNGARIIRDCLEGLLKLEYPNFEVIVVDDGSNDATAAIASEYRFRLIRTENGGLSRARNIGMEAAKGEIIAYIDDDAYPDPHGMPDRWAFRLADGKRTCWGIPDSKLDELYRSCDALLNIVGATDLREVHLAAPFRVYVETDPVTAELQLANGNQHTQVAFSNHQLIATYGENFGASDCRVPLNGLDAKYRKTRQPIDLDFWSMVYEPNARFFTTIGNYRQTGNEVAYKGEVYYWSKHHEWEKFIALPQHTSQPFELAVMPDDPADRARLRAHGWRLVSPLKMSLDIFGDYPAYFRRSRAEFTVAKDQNIRLRSGWFSERDACYLACGKPVVAQDTGFSNVLPTGEGLFAFTTMDEALAAIDRINSDYQQHCKAARAIAEEYFEARKVAGRLLVDIGLA